ncbi:hypothetical protein LDENG_00134550 [Lucifuga dentata]|nr:hypothetical protein LDENG_00134550 [Lucifuga dentata]
MRFLHRVSGLNLRDKVRSSDIREGLSRATAAPPNRKESVEVVRVPNKDASWSSPEGGLPDTSNWEEAPGKTQDTLEGLHLPAGLEMPQSPQEKLEGLARDREV